ncbi:MULTISPECIES: nucleotidyltransferase [unclassified Enterococcus]|uniref:nucleotidyltransferase n=1 Tax=unclassified Enterococcus TaxID=2608891 RepID=UPI0013EB9947|nr:MULTISPECIES: nucleotidyltransferase [unclassified Enterococcus]
MKSCGIIVEYNPFHNGHRYHAQMARKETDAEIVIAVMSGNFLQRGEPALLDKWHRADAALQNGVDLVIELPVEWSVQSADYFAKGAVRLLQELSCDALCFGTEESQLFDYERFGRFVKENQQQINEAFHQLPNQAMSYPQKMTEVFRTLYPKISLDFSSPNHILGLSYAKENAEYDQPMALFPIRRKSADYHDETFSDQTIASATAIRKAISNGESVSAYVPLQTAADIASQSLQTWETYWPYLRYQLISSNLDSLKKIYQMTEGLEVRMQEAAKQADSFSEFVSLVKTKRYTWTRIQRLACYALLNIQTEELRVQQEKQYIRILGFTETGKRFLKEKKGIDSYSRIGKKEAKNAKLLVRSDQIYQLGGEIAEQNFGRPPLSR